MEIAFGHCPSVRFAVPRKDSPPSDRQKTRIYSTAKSGRRNGQPGRPIRLVLAITRRAADAFVFDAAAFR